VSVKGEGVHVSEVAMWHLLSGSPDNVTDDGQVVDVDRSAGQRSEKEVLRAAIEKLRRSDAPAEVRNLGRLAASYLRAGDAETATRYVNRARALLSARAPIDAD
jgi:hypothetical protein